MQQHRQGNSSKCNNASSPMDSVQLKCRYGTRMHLDISTKAHKCTSMQVDNQMRQYRHTSEARGEKASTRRQPNVATSVDVGTPMQQHRLAKATKSSKVGT
ncbi:Hypothetical predicted protein [Olea europaea subsp. europaea]|uniref:Uncharacterized protein n=1 Tax=Olea europaea subsp. europaea TaxID=158383 RepID=A0A8S0SV10_OLEEU|nr:Hypothetical predicted protein [Olea europaea subsp. europaea]